VYLLSSLFANWVFKKYVILVIPGKLYFPLNIDC